MERNRVDNRWEQRDIRDLRAAPIRRDLQQHDMQRNRGDNRWERQDTPQNRQSPRYDGHQGGQWQQRDQRGNDQRGEQRSERHSEQRTQGREQDQQRTRRALMQSNPRDRQDAAGSRGGEQHQDYRGGRQW
ncbi:hypothetical protein D3C81_1503740 [compost metagenome]